MDAGGLVVTVTYADPQGGSEKSSKCILAGSIVGECAEKFISMLQEEMKQWVKEHDIEFAEGQFAILCPLANDKHTTEDDTPYCLSDEVLNERGDWIRMYELIREGQTIILSDLKRTSVGHRGIGWSNSLFVDFPVCISVKQAYTIVYNRASEFLRVIHVVVTNEGGLKTSSIDPSIHYIAHAMGEAIAGELMSITFDVVEKASSDSEE